MAFMAAALLASCSDNKDYSGDFGQIKVPDTRQLEQTAGSDDTQAAKGVTFTTEGAWTSTITATRAEAPYWIAISPDHGDAAGTYTLRITLQPNTTAENREARITITCGTSKIEIVITQKGSDTPEDPDEPSVDPTPQSKWHLTRIDNETVDIYGNRDMIPFRFEYDKNMRLTKITLGETEISGYTLSYPDAQTIKIENLPVTNYREFYTVTLDDKGRAAEVAIKYNEMTTRELWQTFAYDASGYCRESKLYNSNNSFYRKMKFTWKGGNLTAANCFDAENNPDTEDDYTVRYTGYKNDVKEVNLDLNALFGAIPSSDDYEGCSVPLALIDRLGLRSANLTENDLMGRYDYDGKLEGEWLETMKTTYEPIVWTIDAQGRPAKAVSARIITPVKIHQTTGEVVPTGEGKRSTDTYEFHYME